MNRREAFRENLSGLGKVYSFLSQIEAYADSDFEMLYSYGRFLLPNRPFDRDATIVKVVDEVALQYYRLERIYAGPDLREEDAAYERVRPRSDRQSKDEKAPLSEIIEVLNGVLAPNSPKKTGSSFSRSRRRRSKASRSFRLRWPIRLTSSGSGYASSLN